jgi:hypothetical protein
MKILFPLLISSLFFSVVSSIYLRSENTVFDDDGLNFQNTNSNETTEDYTLTLPREEVEEETSCKAVSKHLYIHLLFEDDLKITDVEVSDFDVVILLD